MKKDLSFVAFITLCLVMGLTLGACGSKSNNNGNSGTTGIITTNNNQPSFDCLTTGYNCNTFNTLNGFGPNFGTTGSSSNYQNGICSCNSRTGYELVFYRTNNGTSYSCVPSSSVRTNSSNGGFILSWTLSNNKNGRRGRRNARRNKRNRRNRVNVNIVSNYSQGLGHNYFRNRALQNGTCQQSIAQGCRRDNVCRKYHRNGYHAYCDKGGNANSNTRGVCVFPPQAR